MTTPHICEYYRAGDDFIVLVMTPDRQAMQAWTARADNPRMERADSRIIDVMTGDAVPADHAMFETFCRDNAIDSGIPPRSIALSFRLFAASILNGAVAVSMPEIAIHAPRIDLTPG